MIILGKLIVIDGLDGCGKQTQTAIIKNKLTELFPSKKIESISFPNYDSLSSGPIRMYLGGEISNKPKDVNPYLASLFYSVDRGISFIIDFKAKYSDPDTILIFDRYISANIIYQGEKIHNLENKKEYFKWMYDLEVNKVGIPQEDLTLALTLPIETSQKLMTQRYSGNEDKKDIHEADIEYLRNCRLNLDTACEYLPTIGYNWVKIDCSDSNGWIKTKEEISSMLMQEILKIF